MIMRRVKKKGPDPQGEEAEPNQQQQGNCTMFSAKSQREEKYMWLKYDSGNGTLFANEHYVDLDSVTNIEIYKPTDYEPCYRLWLRCGKVIYDDFYTSDSLSEINRIRDRLLKLCNAEVITLDELAGEEELKFERQ